MRKGRIRSGTTDRRLHSSIGDIPPAAFEFGTTRPQPWRETKPRSLQETQGDSLHSMTTVGTRVRYRFPHGTHTKAEDSAGGVVMARQNSPEAPRWGRTGEPVGDGRRHGRQLTLSVPPSVPNSGSALIAHHRIQPTYATGILRRTSTTSRERPRTSTRSSRPAVPTTCWTSDRSISAR